MHQDRRTRTRVPINCEVLITSSGQEVAVTTWNVSLRGMLCTAHPRLRAGDTCQVKFVLSPDVLFIIQGQVLRTTEDQTAIHFTGMDEDGFYHLKKLVQYNTEDPDRIDSELANPSR